MANIIARRTLPLSGEVDESSWEAGRYTIAGNDLSNGPQPPAEGGLKMQMQLQNCLLRGVELGGV